MTNTPTGALRRILSGTDAQSLRRAAAQAAAVPGAALCHVQRLDLAPTDGGWSARVWCTQTQPRRVGIDSPEHLRQALSAHAALAAERRRQALESAAEKAAAGLLPCAVARVLGVFLSVEHLFLADGSAPCDAAMAFVGVFVSADQGERRAVNWDALPPLCGALSTLATVLGDDLPAAEDPLWHVDAVLMRKAQGAPREFPTAWRVRARDVGRAVRAALAREEAVRLLDGLSGEPPPRSPAPVRGVYRAEDPAVVAAAATDAVAAVRPA